MPDSQFQRPGALLVPSHTEKVRELLQRTRDLENQLATLGKADEDNAAQLRSHLCEVISDLIITDPAVSLEHDMATTLWRSCFYIPICSFRKEISKAKRRKESSPTRAFEHQFKKFLSEALALYDYLSVQYQSKLMQGLTHADSQESSLTTEHVSTIGVVEGLYRLFIYTGDLHRYAESYDKATACYLSATKLSPGNGNPYNQLAVVSQMKDPSLSMNALYWYCRSLLATHSSFETSSNNLERLFTSNRQYLHEHSRGEPPIFFPDKKNPLSSAQKQATTKSCLSHFVDFQYNVLQQGRESDLRAKLSAIFKSLESLLEASAFSDQLLFKLVIINAYSMEKATIGERRQILVEFMFLLGQSFADRLMVTFEEMLFKPNDARQLRSIRLLLPLLIIVDLMARQGDIALVDEGIHFWVKVSLLGTLIRRYLSRIDTLSDQPEPEEFQTLKGYQPYNFLNPMYVAGSPFVDQNEAVKVLELQASQTQSSTVDSRTEETKARMTSFIRACDFCCSQDNIHIHFNGEAYLSRPPGCEQSSDSRVCDSPCIQHLDMEVDPDDDGGDFVVTTSPVNPGLLDSSSIEVRLRGSARGDETTMQNTEFTLTARHKHENRQLSQAAVMPPPGFGFHGSEPPGTPSRLNPEAVDGSAMHPSVLLDDVSVQWPTNVNGPHFAPPHRNTPMQYYGSALHMDHPQGDILSGILLSTHNPFAAPLPQVWPPQNLSHSYSEAYPPIVDMLGSGLLETLFMSDSSTRETRNPFATQSLPF